MAVRGQDIVSVIKRQIQEFGATTSMVDVGTVVEVGDGIARIQGLANARYSELLEFPNGIFGLTLNLEEDVVGAAIMGDDRLVKEGDEVRTTGRIIEVPVGRELLGRVVNPLGIALDGKGPVKTTKFRPAEIVAPDVTTRKSVDQPVQTGVMAIDAMIPIGRGQRELIIGDRSTGKTAIALDAIINQKGKDALIIYDDLTKHAWAYRQMSLLLRRPPGREAYPGDVFYLHSRLLERAARLDAAHGGGSLTALPIIETQANDVSAYIPTNVISITDGQIYLEAELFNAGVRPAVNSGLSVSRVGSSAQTRAMRRVAGRLRIDMAQYRNLATFAQFGTSDLDRATRNQLERGQRATELLKQPQYQPQSVADQVMVLYALTNGFLDNVPVPQVRRWQSEFRSFMSTAHPAIAKSVEEKKDIVKETEDQLKSAIAAFNQGFKA